MQPKIKSILFFCLFFIFANKHIESAEENTIGEAMLYGVCEAVCEVAGTTLGLTLGAMTGLPVFAMGGLFFGRAIGISVGKSIGVVGSALRKYQKTGLIELMGVDENHNDPDALGLGANHLDGFPLRRRIHGG